jgi:hypothetical protein
VKAMRINSDIFNPKIQNNNMLLKLLNLKILKIDKAIFKDIKILKFNTTITY